MVQVIKTNKKGIFAIAMVAILMVACLGGALIILLGNDPAEGKGETVLTVVDDRNKSVNFTEMPQRIVSMGSSFTDIVVTLNGSNMLVGVDNSSIGRAGVPTNMPNLGLVKTLSMESLVGLDPDVVIMWNYNSNKETIGKIEALGINVVAFYPTTVNDTLSVMERIGDMMGSDASALMDSILARVNAVVEKTSALPDHERTTVYLELASWGMSTVANGTLSDQLIRMAGGNNIFANGTKNFVANKEWVVDKNPQVIVVEDSSIRGMEYFTSTYSSTDAVKDNRVHRIPAGTLTTSPQLVDALENLARWLHPELFPEA